MPSRASRQRVIGGGIFLALLGLWLGHTIEYVRVWGAQGLSTELFGSVHAYMLPLAGVIALLGILFASRLWRIWALLGLRLDAARIGLRNALRGRRSDIPAPLRDARPSVISGIVVAWPVLATLQIAFYVIQENLEAVAAQAPAPGLGPITGVHALAPLVHAGVALLLVSLAAVALRLLRRRVEVIAAVEAVTRSLLARLARPPRIDAPPAADVGAPLERLGRHLTRRPPPALIAA